MSFWDVVWFIVISFAFVAYLMVMFTIVADLVRDRSTSGFAKALWVLALILLPVLTSLVYLVTRGNGMAERAARADHVSRPSAGTVATASNGHATPTDQITRARALLDDGVISRAEYEALKGKALV
ncbi:SHOCT domain-containing protein [Modestobacter sp. SSW1-42]|uniref:SHOCT domain-containing protein n=1 Tax=Modestobacter sp. SSW1-42 TaxID=596372 RepID=UPI003985C63C